MPPSLAASKRLKPIATYGRPSRSKFSSFKVFQDVIDDEKGVDKKAKKRPVIPGEYGQLSVQSLSPTVYLDSKFGDADHSISDDEDPFADPASPLRIGSKPPPLPLKQVKVTNPSALPKSEGKKDRLSKRVLADKSTNHPVWAQPVTTTEAVYSSAAPGLPQSFKRETGPSPKPYPKKKLRLNSQTTPQSVLKAEPPIRPRKLRQAGPSLEDQDFPTILLPPKARKPDYESNFRRYSGILENGSESLYNEPLNVLGINGVGMSNGTGVISGAWVREKAKDILSGTKRAAEKILGVSPSSARYKNQQQEIERPKGYRGLTKIIEMPQEVNKWRVKDISASNPIVSEAESLDGDAMSVQDFLEDPFSSPEDFELGRYTNFEVDKNHPPDGPGPNRVAHNRFWRTESTQDLLVLGSTKVQRTNYKQATTTKQPDPNSRIEQGDDRSLPRACDTSDPFIATTNLRSGTAYEFYDLGSDNEMPSSSPMAKSTPKKDWYRYKDNEVAKAFGWKPKRRTREKKQQHPAKDIIITLGSSDTDRLETMTTGGHLGEGDGNERDEKDWNERDKGIKDGAKSFTDPNENGIQGSLNDHKEQRKAIKPTGMEILFLSPALEDEFRKDQSNMKRHERDTTRRDKGGYSLEMGIDEVSDSEKDIRILSNTKTKVGDIQEKVTSRQKRNSVIRIGGLTADRRPKATNRAKGVAASCSDGSNHAAISRAISKKEITAGGVGKKGIKRRKSPLGYGKIETNNDIDELQMDLPGMRI